MKDDLYTAAPVLIGLFVGQGIMVCWYLYRIANALYVLAGIK